MIPQLLEIIKENTQEAVVNNKEIPNEFNSDVQNEILNSLESGFSNSLKGGDISGLLQLFGNGTRSQSLNNNPIVQNVVNGLVDNISQKFNIPREKAQNISNVVVPLVVSKFSQKVANPQDKSVDMNTVIGSLLGGKVPSNGGNDFNSILESLANGKGEGGMDIGKIAETLLSGNSSSRQGSSQDVLGKIGKIAGLFGKRNK